MLLRNNLFNFDRPQNFDTMPVSKLMKGLVFDFDDMYIPFFTPIGTSMLNNVEKVFRTNLEQVDSYEIQIPLIMSNASLQTGQEVGSLFERKIMRLSGKMSEYHLMTSPEMVFINLFAKNGIDSNSMPIKYHYISNIFRNMPDPKHILRTKQIRIIGGVSFDKNAQTRQLTENQLTEALRKSLVDFKIPFHTERFANGASSEFFYLNSKENETYMIPSLDPNNRTKSISLGMIYDYSAECPNDFLHIDPLTKLSSKTFVTSYAFGLQRVLYVIMDHYRDNKGFNLPANIRPYDVVFISSKENMELVKKMTSDLSNAGITTCIDNIFGRAHTKRMDNADYIGAGIKTVIRNNTLSAFDRSGNLHTKTSDPQEVINTIIGMIKQQRIK